MSLPEIAGKKPGITREGQECVYDPVWVDIRPEMSSPLSRAVSACFDRKFLGCYTKVHLRWMKPDGRGGLCPR